MILRTFGWSFAVTILGLLAALVFGGPSVLVIVAILAVLEISLSFDNAVVNAKVLERMSPFWQKIFLTVGIAIAVFGMRLVFPLLVVGLTAKLGPIEAIDLALNNQHEYAARLEDAYPMIAAFGGMFLLLIFLDFVLEERAERWLGWLERPLSRIGRLDQLSVVIAGLALTAVAGWTADNPGQVMIAGVLGMVTYLAVNGLGELFESQGDDDDDEEETAGEGEHAHHAHHEHHEHHEHGAAEGLLKAADKAASGGRRGPNGVMQATGKAAFFLFLYLEVLDASFSFDGVIGAFAVSTELFVIALGLGIGAMYIRSLTVFLVRKGTLHEYVYLEHGAMWAIGALATTMLVSISHHVHEAISGGTGVGFILAAFISSVVRNRREDAASGTSGEDKELQSSNV